MNRRLFTRICPSSLKTEVWGQRKTMILIILNILRYKLFALTIRFVSVWYKNNILMKKAFSNWHVLTDVENKSLDKIIFYSLYTFFK